MSRISIVMPMFNEARHIGRTLLAARKAAHAADIDCELIVVDNGSIDDGPQIARAFGARVLVLPGLLIGALRNRGAAVASGEWLAFIDADIEMPEDWLKQMFALAANDQGDVFGLDLHTPAAAPWFAAAWQRRSLRPSSRATRTVHWLPSANLLMRKQWFDNAGGFNETLRTGEDKEYTLRLHRHGARLLSVNSSVALHWGYEMTWREWIGKELWRQGSHLQLLRAHGMSLRLLRFPLLSVLVWLLDALAILALLTGYANQALLLLMLGLLPSLLLSVRQSIRQQNLGLTLQLWGLHWVRLHLASAALILGLCHWNARRPARG